MCSLEGKIKKEALGKSIFQTVSPLIQELFLLLPTCLSSMENRRGRLRRHVGTSTAGPQYSESLVILTDDA